MCHLLELRYSCGHRGPRLLSYQARVAVVGWEDPAGIADRITREGRPLTGYEVLEMMSGLAEGEKRLKVFYEASVKAMVFPCNKPMDGTYILCATAPTISVNLDHKCPELCTALAM